MGYEASFFWNLGNKGYNDYRGQYLAGRLEFIFILSLWE